MKPRSHKLKGTYEILGTSGQHGVQCSQKYGVLRGLQVQPDVYLNPECKNIITV